MRKEINKHKVWELKIIEAPKDLIINRATNLRLLTASKYKAQ